MSWTAFDQEYSKFRELITKYYKREPKDAMQILKSANARMEYTFNVQEVKNRRGY